MLFIFKFLFIPLYPECFSTWNCYPPFHIQHLDGGGQHFREGNGNLLQYYLGLPSRLSGKESACDAEAAGDVGSIPRLGRSPGGGNGKPLQYSCLENPMDRGTWWATVHRVTKSGTWLKRLSMSTRHFLLLIHLTHFSLQSMQLSSTVHSNSPYGRWHLSSKVVCLFELSVFLPLK